MGMHVTGGADDVRRSAEKTFIPRELNPRQQTTTKNNTLFQR